MLIESFCRWEKAEKKFSFFIGFFMLSTILSESHLQLGEKCYNRIDTES